jgi:hypothetical protein
MNGGGIFMHFFWRKFNGESSVACGIARDSRFQDGAFQKMGRGQLSKE